MIVGSGVGTRELVRTPAVMAEPRLDPRRQVIAAQCSGALVLVRAAVRQYL